jgi:hypothetical protein
MTTIGTSLCLILVTRLRNIVAMDLHHKGEAPVTSNTGTIANHGADVKKGMAVHAASITLLPGVTNGSPMTMMRLGV